VKFEATPLQGAFVITPEPIEDDRGFFARAYCDEAFKAHGLHTAWPQCNLSFNRKAGTLRGMHWQDPPHAEVKLVRVISGALHDVIVDLRPDSATYKQPFGVDLSAENRRMLYIPEGFAHGFLTLDDNTEAFYHMGSPYAPGAARGARYDDPAFSITWPRDITVISDRDRTYPDFKD
jgi:dTDP-4-dehydrorhamnose 3,5-epimerase